MTVPFQPLDPDLTVALDRMGTAIDAMTDRERHMLFHWLIGYAPDVITSAISHRRPDVKQSWDEAHLEDAQRTGERLCVDGSPCTCWDAERLESCPACECCNRESCDTHACAGGHCPCTEY